MKARVVFLVTVLLPGVPAAAAENDGTVHIKSHHSVEDTVERARRMVELEGLRVFGVIDHQRVASEAGRKLSPTRVLVFGNPEMGAQIMQKNRLAGLDLPMKLLVWESKNGTVWISYQRADKLAERYGFSAENKLFVRLGQLIKTLASAAAAAR